MEFFDALIVLAMAVGIPFLLVMYLLPKEKNCDYKEQYLELKTKYDNLSKKDNGKESFKALYNNYTKLNENYVALQKHCTDLEIRHEDYEELKKKYNDLKTHKSSELDEERKHIETEKSIIESYKQSFPYSAQILSDFYSEMFRAEEWNLMNKKNPALKSAEKLSLYATKVKEWSIRAKLAEQQLIYLQSIFPWMEDFIEAPPNEAYQLTQNALSSSDNMKEYYSKWLSLYEYEKLSSTERNQLSLDRYKQRSKSNREVGIEYERYIGYLYESKGFSVSYVGATKGLEDMGRDLIAKNDKKTYIIQCKRWSHEKTIHEKHIFQLYGTVILYTMDHKDENVQPLFVTTTTLSDTACRVSEHLGIIVKSNYNMNDHPLIKCNIGKDGDKIYHLPFDQQYDTIVISPERGEFYADTVAEAESRGFRHAYRWHS